MHYTERQIAEDSALHDISMGVAELRGHLRAIHKLELVSVIGCRPDWSEQGINKYITTIESSCTLLRNVVNTKAQ